MVSIRFKHNMRGTSRKYIDSLEDGGGLNLGTLYKDSQRQRIVSTQGGGSSDLDIDREIP